MQNYTEKDYALNVNSKNIVYNFADGIKELTFEDFLTENPEMTEEDFLYWKTISNEDYLEQDRDEYQQTWKDVSLEALEETELCSSPSPESEIIDAPEDEKRQAARAIVGMNAWETLTETQQRRFWLYHVDSLTLCEIAEMEGVSHVAVLYSLRAAEKRIKKSIKK